MVKSAKKGDSGDSLDALATLAALGVVIGHWNVQNCDKLIIVRSIKLLLSV